jgi:potassium large conductance calcium-activated channel subfamily M alpha protein 1
MNKIFVSNNFEINNNQNEIKNFNIEMIEEKFDTTGMFHWTEEQIIEECMLDGTQKHELSNHVIACIFADKNSPLIGLRNFVLPLRASNYFYEELKPIIFIGNKDFLSKEWKSIHNFPKVYVLDVNIYY